VNLSPTSVPLGGTVNLTVAFTDAGTNDTHPLATVNWGFNQGSSAATVTESGGSGSATASHVYNLGTGTFTVKVLIGDDDLDTANRVATVVVS
jgi:PKD repeat protein